MKTHTMTEAKSDICSIIREVEKGDVLITRHGKPAAIVIGFKDDDDWFDYRLEHDEKFLQKIAEARAQIREGRFVGLGALPD
jgi:prevent-host-death family protein